MPLSACVEIIRIAVGFDNFEFKRLINNEVRVFDSICQSDMNIFSNNKLAIKTKCENKVPLFQYVKIVYIRLRFDNSTFVSLFTRRHGNKRQLR